MANHRLFRSTRVPLGSMLCANPWTLPVPKRVAILASGGGARTAATGRIVNGSLAEYRVPVSADTGVLDVSVIGIPDLKFNPIGSRGIGEIGITVTAAAVANAISNARAGASASIPSRRTSSS